MASILHHHLHNHYHRLCFHPSWSSSSAASQSLSLSSSNAHPTVFCLRKDLTYFSFLSSTSSSSSSFYSTRRVSTAPLESIFVPEDFDFQKEIARLQDLRSRLSRAKNLREKLRVIESDSRVIAFFSTRVLASLDGFDLYELFLLKCLVAAGQDHVFGSELGLGQNEFESVKGSLKSTLYALADMIENWEVKNGSVQEPKCKNNENFAAPLKKLLRTLRQIEQFYDCIGGIIGYQIMVLELLSSSLPEMQSMSLSQNLDKEGKEQFQEIHVPRGLDLSQNTDYASQAALWGIEGLPELGEIYPLGGSGDRLGLVDPHTGHISGAHLNPAVTIAFAALKHFPWKQVPVYIGAQVMASICAAFALKGIFHPFMSGGVTVPSGSNGQAFVLEFIISFNLMFVVTAVATDTRAVGELAGIAVGATVMLNILIAGESTGASMNPVRTLGPAIAANNYKAIWIYLTAPILGALSGAGVYSLVKLPEEDDEQKPSADRSLRR